MMGLKHTRLCSEAELRLFGSKGKYVEGKVSTTLVLNPDHYIPWTMQAFKGDWIHRRIESWNDLIDEEYVHDLLLSNVFPVL